MEEVSDFKFLREFCLPLSPTNYKEVKWNECKATTYVMYVYLIFEWIQMIRLFLLENIF